MPAIVVASAFPPPIARVDGRALQVREVGRGARIVVASAAPGEEDEGGGRGKRFIAGNSIALGLALPQADEGTGKRANDGHRDRRAGKPGAGAFPARTRLEGEASNENRTHDLFFTKEEISGFQQGTQSTFGSGDLSSFSAV